MADEPVNNIYCVLIATIQFLPCSEGRDAQGTLDTTALVEGDSPEDVLTRLKSLPSFADSYNRFSPKERRKLAPFILGEGLIERVAPCDRRFKSRKGDYTCEKPVHDISRHEDQHDDMVNMDGELGMCCINKGYDISEGLGCPYEEEFAHTSDIL